MPLTSKGKSDIFYTPRDLTKWIINYFKPSGTIIEPYSGDGAFSDYMECDTYEIERGKDYFNCHKSYDWEITNPPFSLIRQGLTHSMKLGHNNIVHLAPTSHYLGFKARVRLLKEFGYGIEKIIFIDTPETFPKAGFQIGIIHIKRNYEGSTKLLWKKDLEQTLTQPQKGKKWIQ